MEGTSKIGWLMSACKKKNDDQNSYMHVRSPFQKAEIIALSLAQLTLHSKPELIGATSSFRLSSSATSSRVQRLQL